jgi:beta-fructofuranosidase
MEDSNRPLYHFTAPANWLNDPNGLIQWQGRFHMFYQHNPAAAVWGPMHWGHAVSPDLVHWRHLPIAIAPGGAGPDADGIFSGCAVDTGDRVAFLYTGVTYGPEGPYSRQLPCLAWGSGDLIELVRHPGNPVIAEPPVANTTGFRDHTVWKEGSGWRMAVGSGVKGVGGAAWLYQSSDLVSWDFLGPLCQVADVPPTDIPLGEMWECPSFFEVERQHALVISSCNGGYGPTILTGAYGGSRFSPRVVEKLDYGNNSFYAPLVFFDQAGRCLMIGWLTEARSQEAHLEAGWAGAMSLPRQIHLDADGLPLYSFVPELQALRKERFALQQQMLPPGYQALPAAGQQVEILMELERGDALRSGLVLLRSPDGAVETRLVVDWQANTLTLQRDKSSQDERSVREDLSAELPAHNGSLSLHLYLDGSTVECIIGQRHALTGRVYPGRADAVELGLFSEGGSAKLRSLELFTLKSAW